MVSNILKITCALLFGGAVLAQTGCACKTAGASCVSTKTTYVKAKAPCDTPSDPCVRDSREVTAELPPNAKPGECYAKVFVPATFKTVSERVLVRDASETIEIIPAKYEWVEERMLVKDASTELVAVPAEFAARQSTIQTAAAYTGWEVNKNAYCINPKDQPARDVFCLVNHEGVQTTYESQRQVRAASVQTALVPAEYQTVRRQKLVSAATTRKVCIPAEYETIEKTVKVCDGRMAWQRVICEEPKSIDITMNR